MNLPGGGQSDADADAETGTAMYTAALPVTGGESETIAMDAAPHAQEALTIMMDSDPSSGPFGERWRLHHAGKPRGNPGLHVA